MTAKRSSGWLLITIQRPVNRHSYFKASVTLDKSDVQVMLTMAKAHLRTHETLWVAVIVTELVLRTYQVVQLVFKTCQVVQKNLLVNKPNIIFRATLML